MYKRQNLHSAESKNQELQRPSSSQSQNTQSQSNEGGVSDNLSCNSQENLAGTTPTIVNTNNSIDSKAKGSSIKYNSEYDEGYALISNFFAKTCEAKVELPLAFPYLQPFLPVNQQFDPDIASSVESLYQVYCNTLFENIRFMKFDDLPTTLQSFSSSSISPQMYNLFITEDLYNWVHQSDLLTHRALTKMLSSLIVEFDEIPEIVLNKLSEFSNDYLDLVQQSTLHLPLPMVTSKKNIAKTFSRLVKRLIKVIEASKNLASILAKQETRMSMLYAWEQHVRVFEVVSEEFAHFNYPDLEKRITDIFSIELLEILKKSDEEFDMIPMVKSICEVLENKNLPPRLLVLTFNSFTAACIRELTLNAAESFGLWWMLKAFLDEWVFWYAEVGGFLNE